MYEESRKHAQKRYDIRQIKKNSREGKRSIGSSNHMGKSKDLHLRKEI